MQNEISQARINILITNVDINLIAMYECNWLRLRKLTDCYIIKILLDDGCYVSRSTSRWATAALVS